MQLARKSTQLPKCLLILKGPIWILFGGATAFHTALVPGVRWCSRVNGVLGLFRPEVAGVTFSDSDSAPVPKILNTGLAILQI